MMWSLLVVVTASQSGFLSVGRESFVPGPSVRLGTALSEVMFSRDGRYVSFIDERGEQNYALDRDRVAQVNPPNRKALVRFDIRRGLRETVYVPQTDEVLMRTEFVGAGGDLLFSVAKGEPVGDLLNWRGSFAPVGQASRVLVDGVRARSFHFSASRTSTTAFVLIVNQANPTKVLYVTANATREVTLPVSAYQGIFQFRTASGSTVVGLQGPPPNYTIVGQFELDFANGEARPLRADVEPESDDSRAPLFTFETEPREAASGKPDQFILRDLFVQVNSITPNTPRLRLSEGIVAVTETSVDGLAVVYLTPEGYFLREMVRASPALREKLVKSGGS